MPEPTSDMSYTQILHCYTRMAVAVQSAIEVLRKTEYTYLNENYTTFKNDKTVSRSLEHVRYKMHY